MTDNHKQTEADFAGFFSTWHIKAGFMTNGDYSLYNYFRFSRRSDMQNAVPFMIFLSRNDRRELWREYKREILRRGRLGCAAPRDAQDTRPVERTS